jgi:hypothetical protein
VKQANKWKYTGMITGTKTFSGILVLALFSAVTFPPAHAQIATKISAQEAHDIAVDAYVYFYPLVTMDVTRRQLTNLARPRESSAVR